MTDETPQTMGLEEAARRLDHALSRLEVRMSTLAGQAEQANGGLFDQDRSHLAAELDASRARERELEAAGAAASQALGRAIAGVRTALGD
jgi:hypothetical protein